MTYEQTFLLSLLLTLATEIPVAVFLVRNFYKNTHIPVSKIVFAGIVASALTLPYFWFVLPAYIPSRGLYMIMGESAIVLVEAFIYKQLLEIPFPKSFVVSLAANLVSIAAGALLFSL